MTNDSRAGPRQKWDERYGALPADDLKEPTPFVVACLPQLPGAGRALDIAAGVGRNSLALAQRGFRVDAVDISWQGLRLGRRRALAAGLNLGQIQFIVADVERPWLPQYRYDLILVSRFLHRPLFSLIKERLAPGGWLMYETFLAEPEAQADCCEDFLLKPGELREAFLDFEIILYDESIRSGGGNHRATAQLLARKSIE